MPETTYTLRTYQQRITTNHKLYKTLEDLTIKAKNIYNLALFNLRQEYFNTNSVYPKFQLQNDLKSTEAFKTLPAATSQQIIHNTYDNFNAFIKATESYKRNPTKFTGKPKLPKYKKKFPKSTVYFSNQQLKILDNSTIRLPKDIGTLKLPDYLSGIQVKPTKFDLNYQIPKLELTQLRIIPKKTSIIIEYVYTKQITIPDKPSKLKVASIDLGLNNFIAMAITDSKEPAILINGKGLKSYNHYFNKALSSIQSQLPVGQHTSKRIQLLYDKRNRYMRTKMHQISRYIVDYLVDHEVSQLIIGHNKFQKQNINIGSKLNQQIVQIPYNTLINQLKYKCKESNIELILVEESYTSGTSFLDNEQPTEDYYNSKRRIHRGLFLTNTGIKINSDVNASYQILRKVYQNFKVNDPKEINLQALKINVS